MRERIAAKVEIGMPATQDEEEKTESGKQKPRINDRQSDFSFSSEP